MTTLPSWLHAAWAVAGVCTFIGGGCWLVFFFWPALKEQLAFIRRSLIEMEAGKLDREKMVHTLERLDQVAAKIEQKFDADIVPTVEKAKEIVGELQGVQWKEGFARAKKVSQFAEAWIDRITPERVRRGQERMEKGLSLFHRLSMLVTGTNGKSW